MAYYALTEVKETLAPLGRFVLVENPGNAGDSLIAHATHQFLRGRDYENGSWDATFPGRDVVYSGGGNLVPFYEKMNRFLLANAGICNRLVVLPHTIRAHEGTLATLGANCTVICRDQPSYDFTKRHARRAKVLLSHDMAFALDIDDALRQRCGKEFGWRRLLVTTRYRMRSPKVLNSFRGDVEKTDTPIPSPNLDISKFLGGNDMKPETVLRVTRRMIRFVRTFDTVNTNRLHVGILAALLGKTVNLFDNSYGKNRSIYEHSLKNFPKVRFCE